MEIEDLQIKTEYGYHLAYRYGHPMAEKIADWFKSMARPQETDIHRQQ